VTARKSERLLNLLITLLVARSYVGKDRIRSVIEQYRDAGDEAFEKMFERDKEELRSLGIPLEVGYLDRSFEDEPGYRIDRSAFELPPVDLEPDEAAVVGLAARVWQHAGLASATSDALVKLKAAGVTVDRDVLDVVQPQLTADEPAFEGFWDAVRSRTPVAFDYRTATSDAAATRHLQPWGVVSFRGRWYVVGHDTDRADTRLFRLSRVTGPVRPEGEPGGFTVPEGTDIRSLTARLAPAKQDRTAVLRVRPGTCQGLRRRGRPLDHATAGGSDTGAGSGAGGWDRVEVDYAATDGFVDELLGYGADVVVESPPEARDLVVARLEQLVGAGR
jgi:proteasome accessory factor B